MWALSPCFSAACSCHHSHRDPPCVPMMSLHLDSTARSMTASMSEEDTAPMPNTCGAPSGTTRGSAPHTLQDYLPFRTFTAVVLACAPGGRQKSVSLRDTSQSDATKKNVSSSGNPDASASCRAWKQKTLGWMAPSPRMARLARTCAVTAAAARGRCNGTHERLLLSGARAERRQSYSFPSPHPINPHVQADVVLAKVGLHESVYDGEGRRREGEEEAADVVEKGAVIRGERGEEGRALGVEREEGEVVVVGADPHGQLGVAAEADLGEKEDGREGRGAAASRGICGSVHHRRIS